MESTRMPEVTDEGVRSADGATAHGPITDEADDRDEPLHGGMQPTPWGWARHARPYLVAGCAYLLLSVLIWIHVWSSHPSSVTACGCGDTAPTVWYMAWPAYAFLHGLNPLYSTTIGYPTGVNLIFTAFGIVMAPVTWLFGPVLSVNVILTVSPVLSALAMFALARRWVAWTPAAFFAGLFYGFSPFVVTNLGVAHVDFVMLAIPPLVALCLDELLIRQQRSPVAVGIILGLFLSAQFFVGVEILTLMIIEAGIAILMIALYAAVRNPDRLREHAGRTILGGCVAALTALVVFAFPAWFAFAGPAHFSDVSHPGVQLTKYSASIADAVFAPPIVKNLQWQQIVGGYQGPALNAQYFGIGVVLVCLGGLIIWRRDRLLWLFGGLSVVTLLLAASSGPWFAKLPVLKNVFPVHFIPFMYLTVAVVLALIVDHTRSAIRALAGRRLASEGHASPGLRKAYSWSGALAATAVALVAIAPPAAYLAKSIPLTAETIVLPTWFRVVAPKLPGRPVVLALPAPFTTTARGATWEAANGQRYLQGISIKQSALLWHALTGQGYSLIGTGGLGVGVKHNPGENHGQNVITRVTFAYGASPIITSADIVAVHRAISEWGVTMVVLPDQPELPSYDKVASVTAMAALISAATGAKPVHVANAWVWRGVNRDNPVAYPSATQYAQCTNGWPTHGTVAVRRTTACVLRPT